MSEERFDLVIRGRRILTTAGIAAREVGVRGGKIVALEPLGNGLAGAEVIELADDETLIPGLVDTHVHVNEPGRTEWKASPPPPAPRPPAASPPSSTCR